MITNASTLRRSTADRADAAEQLTLLPNDSVTPRFRLSRDTRERGLRHVAEIRRMLAERAHPLHSPWRVNRSSRRVTIRLPEHLDAEVWH